MLACVYHINGYLIPLLLTIYILCDNSKHLICFFDFVVVFCLFISDVPVPALKLVTPWSDVFPSERVEMSCAVQGSSDWSFTWYRNGDIVSGDSAVSLGAEGESLTILSATQTHQGLYTCTSHHKTRNIGSGPSNSVDITVHCEFQIITLNISLSQEDWETFHSYTYVNWFYHDITVHWFHSQFLSYINVSFSQKDQNR